MTQTISARGITIEQLFGEKVSKLGENMGIARFVREEIAGTGAVSSIRARWWEDRHPRDVRSRLR